MTSMSCSAASGCSLPCGKTIGGFSARAAAAVSKRRPSGAEQRSRRAASSRRSRGQRAAGHRFHRLLDRHVRDALAAIDPAVAVQARGVLRLPAVQALVDRERHLVDDADLFLLDARRAMRDAGRLPRSSCVSRLRMRAAQTIDSAKIASETTPTPMTLP